MRTLTPTGMSTSGEREAWSPVRDQRVVTIRQPDPYIAAVAAKECAKGLAHVRRINDEWRAEVGMPRRLPDAMQLAVQIQANCDDFRVAMERAAESIRAAERYAIPFRYTAGVHNPGAPDGRNNWEDAPAVADALSPERNPFPLVVAGRRAGKTQRLADMAATPIYDAVEREMGAPL